MILVLFSKHSGTKRFFLCICASLSQGLGTDEDTLTEILASRTNRQILDIKKAYKEGECQQILSNNFQLYQASV